MTTRPRIVVGIDGSSRGDDALAFALALGDTVGTGVLLVHAYGPGKGARARAILASRGSCPASVTVESIAYGDDSPARALDRVAAARNASFIVVGPSHRAGLGLVLPGSTGQQLVHRTRRAVVVVPRGWRSAGDPPLRRVGCGYDGSAESQAALDAAVALTRLSGGDLQVMRAFWSPPLAGSQAIAAGADLEARARAGLGEAVQRLPEDLPARARVLLNDPARALLAQSRDLDLLVLGSRAHGPLSAAWAGSVSGPVMREAACPVLVVPRGVRPALLNAA